MKARAKRIWKWGDVVLAGATILAAALLWLYPVWTAARAAGGQLAVVVRVADGTEQKLPLSGKTVPRDVPFASNGYTYTIRVEEGRARVLTADCPDRVCVVTGWLSRPGQLAACVPGRMLLRVEAGTADASPGDVDVVSR